MERQIREAAEPPVSRPHELSKDCWCDPTVVVVPPAEQGQIHDPDPGGNHTPRQISEHVAHLRLLAETYDGVDAEDWATAADTIERLDMTAQSYRARADRYRAAYNDLLATAAENMDCALNEPYSALVMIHTHLGRALEANDWGLVRAAYNEAADSVRLEG